jgi:hypothetical protein
MVHLLNGIFNVLLLVLFVQFVSENQDIVVFSIDIFPELSAATYKQI